MADNDNHRRTDSDADDMDVEMTGEGSLDVATISGIEKRRSELHVDLALN